MAHTLMTPSPHLLIPFPDLRHAKTGEAVNVETFSGIHFLLSTAVLDEADSLVGSELNLSLPSGSGSLAAALEVAAERFASECLTAAITAAAEKRLRCDEQPPAGLVSQTSPAAAAVTA
jgi:hypothetical protein